MKVRRGGVVVGAGLVLATAVALLIGAGARTSVPLDPDNPGPDGAQALARVLDRSGVDVRIVHGAQSITSQPVDGTTYLVTDPDKLGKAMANRLRQHTRGTTLIIVDPGRKQIDDARVEAVDVDEVLRAGCREFGLTPGLRLDVNSARVLDGGTGGCFRVGGSDGGPVLAQAAPGLVVFGAGEIWSNDQILRADHAAIALRMLGQTDRLVWYRPSIDDVPGDTTGARISDLLPPWLRPSVVILLVAAIALLWWRGRRLGPLEVEPLPVTIRADESTRSRGRLYQRAGDRAHAATVLRTSGTRRTATALALPPGSDPAVVAAAAADRLDRSSAEVAALLDPAGPAPQTDAELVALATALADIEQEARRP